MPKSYNTNIVDPATTVKACLSNARVSFKNTRETCSTLRGRTVEGCIAYLNDVIAKKDCVPMRRYASGCGNTSQAAKYNSREHRCTRGRWPKKSAETVIKILNNIKNNAVNKSLDPADLVIQMVSVNKAPKIHGRIFRAHGRVNAFNSSPCHIQMVAVKRSESVPVDGEIVQVQE
uniref:Large ribosomal subunit protein uL22 n=1 Tax=Homalodisca liturata TaxID=320908 RepID=A0A1B6JQS2_9HEMI